MASVYLKCGTWYLQVLDGLGRRRCMASTATTKSEAKRLAVDLDKRYERQRFGVEPQDLENGGGTVDELMEWWIDKFLSRGASDTGTSSIRKHMIGSALGQLQLTAVTPGKIDLFLAEKERVLSARSVNHLRGYLSRAFTMARRMERFPRPNPVADVPKRKVAKRLPDYLRPAEVLPLLVSLAPKWRALFATAIYTGMRKGELFALQKTDIDLSAGLIVVSRSHERDIPKGGRSEAIPINSELDAYLRRAIAASPSELVFPAESGEMRPRHTALEHVLRRAMRRGGLVTGYIHKCRRSGCGHRETAPDANLRRCSLCNFKLFPVGEVRKIRFHHLRHTTASLLLMNGADLAAVQRIMRHQDPRLTTEVYGHLAPHYLKREIERLSFGVPHVEEDASETEPGRERQSQLAAGGAQEPPLPADTRADERFAAPFTTRLLPDSQKGRAATSRARAVGKESRGLAVVGARGFEPPTFRSRTERATRLRHAPN
jgi:integrase